MFEFVCWNSSDMTTKKYFLVIIFLMLYGVDNATATNPIMITISSDMDKIIFDGRWTHETEWKRSSLDTLSYDDETIIQLRTAHQDNFIYVFVDAVTDTHLDSGMDRTVICLDGNNDKLETTNADDYCFVVTLDEKESFVLQGGSSLELNDHFTKIVTPEGFIGMSSVSDENDRYSKIPHPSYEFRIPIELVGRKDTYGFYLGVYDAHSNKTYSWTQNIILGSIQVPSPSTWGELVSPDKSLPEFEWPMLALLPAFSLAVYLTKFRYR